MGFLKDNSQPAATQAPVSTPTASAIDSLLSQGSIAGNSPPQTVDPATMTQAPPPAGPSPALDSILSQGPIAGAADTTQTMAPADVPQNPLPQPNFLQRIGIDSNGLPAGTGVGGKRSILDIIGHIADTVAQVGGETPQYQPTLDANAARQQLATTNGYQNQESQQTLDSNAVKLAQDHAGQLGQLANGLTSLYGQGTPEDIAKVQKAVPTIMAALGIKPEDPQAKVFMDQLATNPHDAIAGLHAALTKDTAAGSTAGNVQTAEYIKEHGTPEQYQQYLTTIANPNAIKPFQQAQLSQGSERNRIAAFKALHPASQLAGEQAAAGMDPRAIDMLASRFRAGQPVPLGRGGVGGPVGTAIVNRAAQQALVEGGGAIRDPAGFVANFKANAASLTKLQPQVDQITAFENSARGIGNNLVSVLSKGAAGGQSPVLNRWIQGGRRAIAGDPDVTALDTYMRDYNMEVGKVIAGTTGSSRAPTNAMQANLDHLMNSSMGYRTGELKNQLNVIKSRMAPPVASHAPSATGGNPPAGATKTATGAGGSKVALVNGRWVPY